MQWSGLDNKMQSHVRLRSQELTGFMLWFSRGAKAVAKGASSLVGVCSAILLLSISANAQVDSAARAASDIAFIPDINAAREIPSSKYGVQMKKDSAGPLVYFLDKVPDDIRVSALPAAGKDVLLAKVRLLGVPAFMGGRGPRGGRSQDPLPKELLSARVKILEVLSGQASVDSVFNVTFGQVDQTHSLIPVPRTKSELEKDYFVVLYADDGGQWHLAGFPMGEAEYRKWEEKFWADERERMGIAPKR